MSETPTPAGPFCHQCGSKLVGTAQFCSSCGIEQVASTSSPAVVPAEPAVPTEPEATSPTKKRRVTVWSVGAALLVVLMIVSGVLAETGYFQHDTIDGADRTQVEAYVKRVRKVRDETNQWLDSMTAWAKEGDLAAVRRNCRTLEKVAMQQWPRLDMKNGAPWRDVGRAAADASEALFDYGLDCAIGEPTDESWATWRSALDRFDTAMQRHID